jgi:hypothetical protein
MIIALRAIFGANYLPAVFRAQIAEALMTFQKCLMTQRNVLIAVVVCQNFSLCFFSIPQRNVIRLKAAFNFAVEVLLK